jgi:hypothetical protein
MDIFSFTYLKLVIIIRKLCNLKDFRGLLR